MIISEYTVLAFVASDAPWRSSLEGWSLVSHISSDAIVSLLETYVKWFILFVPETEISSFEVSD